MDSEKKAKTVWIAMMWRRKLYCRYCGTLMEKKKKVVLEGYDDKTGEAITKVFFVFKCPKMSWFIGWWHDKRTFEMKGETIEGCEEGY